MPRSDPDPERLVRVAADADVLAADLLCGDEDNPARDAMDLVRAHDWLDLVATGSLLDDAAAVVSALADPDLAADWRAVLEERVTVVDAPSNDQPALAAAYRGGCAHVLSFDERLRSARTGAELSRIDVSVKPPDAFARLFDPATVYEAAFDEPYPGAE